MAARSVSSRISNRKVVPKCSIPSLVTILKETTQRVSSKVLSQDGDRKVSVGTGSSISSNENAKLKHTLAQLGNTFLKDSSEHGISPRNYAPDTGVLDASTTAELAGLCAELERKKDELSSSALCEVMESVGELLRVQRIFEQRRLESRMESHLRAAGVVIDANEDVPESKDSLKDNVADANGNLTPPEAAIQKDADQDLDSQRNGDAKDPEIALKDDIDDDLSALERMNAAEETEIQPSKTAEAIEAAEVDGELQGVDANKNIAEEADTIDDSNLGHYIPLPPKPAIEEVNIGNFDFRKEEGDLEISEGAVAESRGNAATEKSYLLPSQVVSQLEQALQTLMIPLVESAPFLQSDQISMLCKVLAQNQKLVMNGNANIPALLRSFYETVEERWLAEDEFQPEDVGDIFLGLMRHYSQNSTTSSWSVATLNDVVHKAIEYLQWDNVAHIPQEQTCKLFCAIPSNYPVDIACQKRYVELVLRQPTETASSVFSSESPHLESNSKFSSDSKFSAASSARSSSSSSSTPAGVTVDSSSSDLLRDLDAKLSEDLVKPGEKMAVRHLIRSFVNLKERDYPFHEIEIRTMLERIDKKSRLLPVDICYLLKFLSGIENQMKTPTFSKMVDEVFHQCFIELRKNSLRITIADAVTVLRLVSGRFSPGKRGRGIQKPMLDTTTGSSSSSSSPVGGSASSYSSTSPPLAPVDCDEFVSWLLADMMIGINELKAHEYFHVLKSLVDLKHKDPDIFVRMLEIFMDQMNAYGEIVKRFDKKIASNALVEDPSVPSHSCYFSLIVHQLSKVKLLALPELLNKTLNYAKENYLQFFPADVSLLAYSFANVNQFPPEYLYSIVPSSISHGKLFSSYTPLDVAQLLYAYSLDSNVNLHRSAKFQKQATWRQGRQKKLWNGLSALQRLESGKEGNYQQRSHMLMRLRKKLMLASRRHAATGEKDDTLKKRMILTNRRGVKPTQKELLKVDYAEIQCNVVCDLVKYVDQNLTKFDPKTLLGVALSFARLKCSHQSLSEAIFRKLYATNAIGGVVDARRNRGKDDKVKWETNSSPKYLSRSAFCVFLYSNLNVRNLALVRPFFQHILQHVEILTPHQLGVVLGALADHSMKNNMLRADLENLWKRMKVIFEKANKDIPSKEDKNASNGNNNVATASMVSANLSSNLLSLYQSSFSTLGDFSTPDDRRFMLSVLAKCHFPNADIVDLTRILKSIATQHRRAAHEILRRRKLEKLHEFGHEDGNEDEYAAGENSELSKENPAGYIDDLVQEEGVQVLLRNIRNRLKTQSKEWQMYSLCRAIHELTVTETGYESDLARAKRPNPFDEDDDENSPRRRRKKKFKTVTLTHPLIDYLIKDVAKKFSRRVGHEAFDMSALAGNLVVLDDLGILNSLHIKDQKRIHATFPQFLKSMWKPMDSSYVSEEAVDNRMRGRTFRHEEHVMNMQKWQRRKRLKKSLVMEKDIKLRKRYNVRGAELGQIRNIGALRNKEQANANVSRTSFDDEDAIAALGGGSMGNDAFFKMLQEDLETVLSPQEWLDMQTRKERGKSRTPAVLQLTGEGTKYHRDQYHLKQEQLGGRERQRLKRTAAESAINLMRDA